MKYISKFTLATRNIRSILVLIIVFIVTGANSKVPGSIATNTTDSQIAIANYLAAQENLKLNDEEKIRVAIEAYFITKYEGQKSLIEQDFSPLIENATLEWVMKEKEKRGIELYIASLFDLGYQDYKFNLAYKSIEINGNEATVELLENHRVVFNAIAPEESIMANLKHVFTLHNIKHRWLISQDEYEDELSIRLDHFSNTDIKRQVYETYQIDLENQKQSVDLSKSILVPTANEDPSLINYTYDRTEAVHYADSHIPEICPLCNYNILYYKTEASDCANFVSQAIYAGGGGNPPDTSAMTVAGSRDYDTDWYYNFNYPVGTSTGAGSVPWVRVQEKRDFILQNDSDIGPYGYETNNICSLQKGDIVQLFGVHMIGVWDHEGLVVGKGTGCGTLSNTLVDAHTADRYHYPLSYWSVYSMRYVIISGFRSDKVSIFADVQPTNWAWLDIEKIYNNSITAGCSASPLNYCPSRTLTRAQMAVFILRGEHGSSYTPPAASGTVFNDVPANAFAADWIEQLYAESITGGCGGGNYCPNSVITHAEMAVFLLRARYGSTYVPPAATGTMFNDVPASHWAAKWIEDAANKGFSYGQHGCGPSNFCPAAQVTRAEMAGLLVRTFNLP